MDGLDTYDVTCVVQALLAELVVEAAEMAQQHPIEALENYLNAPPWGDGTRVGQTTDEAELARLNEMRAAAGQGPIGLSASRPAPVDEDDALNEMRALAGQAPRPKT